MFDSLLFWHIPSAASEPVTITFCVRFHSPSSMLKSYCSFNPLWTMNTTIFQEMSNLYHILEAIFGRLFQKIIFGCSLEQFHWTVQLCKETLQHGFGAFFFQSCDRLFSLFSYRKIDNNTWARGDMEFLFECWTRYLTSERSERVRYRIEHEKRNSISPSNRVLLCLLYKYKSPQY